jgi:hypothetical protein
VARDRVALQRQLRVAHEVMPRVAAQALSLLAVVADAAVDRS